MDLENVRRDAIVSWLWLPIRNNVVARQCLLLCLRTRVCFLLKKLTASGIEGTHSQYNTTSDFALQAARSCT
jgi:hypothetical protein